MKRRAIVIFTNDTCTINGRLQPGLPLLLDSQRRVVHSTSDWFRYQAVFLNYPTTTLRLYSDIMLSFWNYLIEQGADWMDVDDNLLIKWRNHQEIELGIDRRTINQRLSTVFQFYSWAQSRDYIQNVVADPNNPEDSSSPRISTGIKLGKSRSGMHPNFTISSPLLYRTTRVPNVHTPTAEEATKLHAVLANLYGPTVAERNTLMLSWAEEAGLRRKEFASLTVNQIPDWNEIYDLIQQDSCKDLKLVVTKGGHHRIVEIVPDLLLRTRNYIEEDRLAVVHRFKQKHPGVYKAAAAVFLSEKTGKALTFGAISNLIGAAFKEASVSGSGHRMRARYLTNLVQHYYDEALAKQGNSISFDIVLLKAAEAAGHARPESLRPYLNLIRKRRLTTQDGGKRRYLQQRLLSIERDLNLKSKQLDAIAALSDLAKAIRSGKKSKTRLAWTNLESELSVLL